MKKKVKDQIIKIGATVASQFSLTDEPGFSKGKAGMLLFLFHYSRWKQDNEMLNRIEELIEQVIARKVTESYADGLPGIGWILNHINGYLKNRQIEQFLKDADVQLYEVFRKIIKLQGDSYLLQKFDLLYGLNGYLNYFIYRENKYKGKVVDYYINKLKNNYEKLPSGGIRWLATEHAIEHNIGCNLGLAHGLSGILSSLINSFSIGDPETIKFLLIESIQYLLNQKNSPQSLSVFPRNDRIVRNPPIESSSRLGWCNGDLGIGLMLLRAGKLLENRVILEEGRETFLKASKRRHMEENKIFDAGLCHGSSGVSFLFKVASDIEPNDIYLDAADYWLEKTLEFATFPDGACGYKTFRGDNTFYPDFGFLSGISGIGLILLSSIDDNTLNSGWQKSIFL